MKVISYTMEGEESGEVELPDSVFGVPMNDDLLHQAVRVSLARQRRVLAHTKDRGEVRGGGRKPWRQKGTGRARHGSIRSPLWRGGGVAFGPRKDRNFTLMMPEAMRKKALAVALSAKARDGEVIVLESLQLTQPKTKEVVELVRRILRKVAPEQTAKRQPSLMIATPGADTAIYRAARNIPYVSNIPARALTVLDVLSSRYLLFPKAAIPIFEACVRRREKSSARESN